MANYYPYQNNYYPQQNPQQVQNNGFISVRNESEARNYPVAFGNSVTFKDENAPYVYTKTMGFSQLDRPVFDKYRLVKEDVEEEVTDNNLTHNQLELIKSEFDKLWDEINELKKKPSATKRDKSGGAGNAE